MTMQEISRLIETHLTKFTVMLAISIETEPGKPTIISNGTGALVNTGEAELLVTNAHVYNGYLECLKSDPSAKLNMSGDYGQGFWDISTVKPIDIDCGYDLATFAMSASMVNAKGKYHMQKQSWPPPRAKEGMLGFLLAYPGETRGLSVRGLEVRPLVYGMGVASVSEKKFILAPQSSNVSRYTPEDTKPLTNLGGISGCAVYIWDDSAEILADKMFLGGFEFESMDTDIVYVSHADHIKADGTML
jgi:hypothetical protein